MKGNTIKPVEILKLWMCHSVVFLWMGKKLNRILVKNKQFVVCVWKNSYLNWIQTSDKVNGGHQNIYCGVNFPIKRLLFIIFSLEIFQYITYKSSVHYREIHHTLIKCSRGIQWIHRANITFIQIETDQWYDGFVLFMHSNYHTYNQKQQRGRHTRKKKLLTQITQHSINRLLCCSVEILIYLNAK